MFLSRTYPLFITVNALVFGYQFCFTVAVFLYRDYFPSGLLTHGVVSSCSFLIFFLHDDHHAFFQLQALTVSSLCLPRTLYWPICS